MGRGKLLRNNRGGVSKTNGGKMKEILELIRSMKYIHFGMLQTGKHTPHKVQRITEYQVVQYRTQSQRETKFQLIMKQLTYLV